MLGHRVMVVSTDEDGASVQVSDGEERRTLRSRALVLASGFGSDLTGQLGLGKVGDFATGVQAEVMAPDVDRIHVYFGRGIAPGSFAWLVPTREGRALVGLLCRHRGHAHLEKLLLKLQAQGVVTEVTRAPSRWGIPLRPLPRTYGRRVLAVGDVAGQVKPTTGGGMYYSLLASEIAADTLHSSLLEGDLSAQRLSRYEVGWKALLSREMEVGYSARRLFELTGDRQIDFVMHTIARNGFHQELVDSAAASFDWHSGVIGKLLGHPILAKTLQIANPILAATASHS